MWPNQPPIQFALWAVSPGIKRTKREAEHLPTSNSRFKDE